MEKRDLPNIKNTFFEIDLWCNGNTADLYRVIHCDEFA